MEEVNLNTGIYVDAKHYKDIATIAIIVMENGQIVTRQAEILIGCCSQSAEEKAILIAKDNYQVRPVFCDNATAAKRFGAVWIPRKKNRVAHIFADKVWENYKDILGIRPPDPIYKINGYQVIPEPTTVIHNYFPKRLKKHRKKKYMLGRGVIPVGKNKFI